MRYRLLLLLLRYRLPLPSFSQGWLTVTKRHFISWDCTYCADFVLPYANPCGYQEAGKHVWSRWPNCKWDQMWGIRTVQSRFTISFFCFFLQQGILRLRESTINGGSPSYLFDPSTRTSILSKRGRCSLIGLCKMSLRFNFGWAVICATCGRIWNL